MADLKAWLCAQGLTVRDFAFDLDVSLKTAQSWVYRGVLPSRENQGKVTEYLHAHCAHYWVIAVPDGPFSEGVCQRCGHLRQFQNSSPEIRWSRTPPPGDTANTVSGKSVAWSHQLKSD